MVASVLAALDRRLGWQRNPAQARSDRRIEVIGSVYIDWLKDIERTDDKMIARSPQAL